MIPERLNFLNRFDRFYQVMVNSVKENKIKERDFYLIISAKAKSMNRERREKKLLSSSRRLELDRELLINLGDI